MARFLDNEIISLIGKPPRHDLAESVGPDLRIGELFDGAMDTALADLPLSYGTAQGDLQLRRAIADRHGTSAENVVTTVGAMHALSLLGLVLCDRGDDVVISSPCFPPTVNAFRAAGANVLGLSLQFDHGYQPDMAAFESVLTSRTRVVVLASPENPAGVTIGVDTLRSMLDLMARRSPEAYLVVDETYREAVYGGNSAEASAVGLGPRVVVLASLSKCHGAPGLRLGWVITNDAALRGQLVVAKFNTVLSCSTVDETLGLRVLQRHEGIISARRQRLANGLAAVEQWVQESASLVEWVRPDAGALCCVRLRREAFDEDDVVAFYSQLETLDARVGSGTWFGEEARVFRVGFGYVSQEQLQGALVTLTRAMARVAR